MKLCSYTLSFKLLLLSDIRRKLWLHSWTYISINVFLPCLTNSVANSCIQFHVSSYSSQWQRVYSLAIPNSTLDLGCLLKHWTKSTSFYHFHWITPLLDFLFYYDERLNNTIKLSTSILLVSINLLILSFDQLWF